MIPVLDRPSNAPVVVASLKESERETKLNPYFVCLADDEIQLDACLDLEDARTFIVPWDLGAGDYARKINYGFKMTKEPFALMGADDLRFYPGWAEAALDVMYETDTGVVGTDDLGNSRVRAGQHSTHPLILRGYIEECGGTVDGDGLVLHEGYFHNFCDDELVSTAKYRGCFGFARGATVEHLHPNWKKAILDPTYERALSNFATDSRRFRERSYLWNHRRR